MYSNFKNAEIYNISRHMCELSSARGTAVARPLKPSRATAV